MTSPQKIAAHFGLTLGKLTRSDTRRIIDHESKPFYVGKDDRIIKQFSTAKDRANWLSSYEDVQGLSAIPDPKPMNARALDEGDRIDAGEPGTGDYDTGIILTINGDRALVGWDTGTKTWAHLEDLRLR